MLAGPLVVDTHVLGRRPGTERALESTIEAPADLGHDVIGVPEGSTIDLAFRLEAVMDGVLVTGTASARTIGECVRCLAEIDEPLVVDFQELYVYEPVATGEDADDEMALEDDLLDLEPVLRDAVVLALPLNPLCGPDCPGLCPDCGARLADDPGHTHGEAVDPRWASLSQLKTEMNQPGTSPDSPKE